MDVKKIGIAAVILALLPVIVIITIIAPAGEEEECRPVLGGNFGSAPAGSLVKPVDPATVTLTSGYGPRGGAMHHGIDLAGDLGTPIYAYTDGRVVAAGEAAGFGNWIVIDHEIDGQVVSSVYGHMAASGVLVSDGEEVRAGQKIAEIGNEGQSSGPHLHFELWDGGRFEGQSRDPSADYDAAANPGEISGGDGGDTPDGRPAPVTDAQIGGLNDRQLAIAKQIVAIGEALGFSEHGIIVALSTAAQESTYRMLANDGTSPNLKADQPADELRRSMDFPHDGVGNDHGSVNQYQQQFPWWGSIDQLMNSSYANWKFYDALSNVSGWESMPVTVAAQSVQGSQFPDAYAPHQGLATQLATHFRGSGAELSAEEIAALGDGTAQIVLDGGSGACASGSAAAGQLRNLGDISDFGGRVIAAAEQWTGTDYAWGGGDANGPTQGIRDGGPADAHGDFNKIGFDCSGLVLHAVYQASGGQVQLPRTAAMQASSDLGQPIPMDQIAPGDLIYFGPDGAEHHVGIYIGQDESGQDMLLNARQSGETVTVHPLSGWANETQKARRFG